MAVLRSGLLVVFVAIAAARTPSQVVDSFAFFQPTVTVSDDDLDLLHGGDTVARTVPAHGNSVAVFAAVPVDIRGDRLEGWVHNITAFKQSRQVLAIGRFSDPPVLEDLARLNFPDGDLEDLLHCQPGHCGLKLTRAEIAELRRCLALDSTPAALQDALRRLVLQRVQTYLAQGQGALGSYEDRATAVPVAAAFSTVLQESVFLTQHLPQLSAFVEQWPRTNGLLVEPVQSFVYWSEEDYGAKPIVSATHVFIRRANGNGIGLPETLVIGKQIFATHYIDASLGVTALVRDAQNGRAYLVYVNRSSVDILKGFWGGLIRRILQRRLKAEAPAVLSGLRRRLESGRAPAQAGFSVEKKPRLES